jgi:YD repeat-containing protein
VESGGVLVRMANGNRMSFFEDGDAYVSAYGDPFGATFVRNLDDSFSLRDRFGNFSHFNPDGLIARREDRNGNVTTFSYIDADGDSEVDDIESIVDFVGRETFFDYDYGLISTVTAPREQRRSS